MAPNGHTWRDSLDIPHSVLPTHLLVTLAQLLNLLISSVLTLFLSCLRISYSIRVTSGFPRASGISLPSQSFLLPCLPHVPILRLSLLICISSLASSRKLSWLILLLPSLLDTSSTSHLITGCLLHAALCHHLSFYDISFYLFQSLQGLGEQRLPGGSL